MNKKCKKNTIARGVIFLAIILMFLVISEKTVNARYIMTYLYGQGDYLSMIEDAGNIFNEVSPSYFDITDNGDLRLNYIDTNLICELHSKNIKVVPFLSNHWDRDAR